MTEAATFVRDGDVIVGTECCECASTTDTKLCQACDPTVLGVRTLYYCRRHMKSHAHYRKTRLPADDGDH